MRAAVAERLAGQLDRQDVQEELLEIWSEAESAALGRRASLTKPDAAGLRHRPAAVQLLTGLGAVAETPLQCWSKALSLFDDSAHALGETATVERVLARLGAAWLMSMKCEHAGDRSSAEALAARVSAYSVSLGGAAVTKADILWEERLLLIEHSSAINLPTVHQWLSMVTVRFGVATGGRCNQSLQATQQWASVRGAAAAGSAPALPENPPKRLAVGVFGLQLIAARVVPHEALRPPAISRQTWTAAIEEALACAWAPPQAAGAGPPDSRVTLAALEYATGRSHGEARASVWAVLALTSWMTAEARC